MKEIWKKCLSEVRKNIQKEAYEKWFKNIELIAIENNIASISVPNNYCSKVLNANYKKELEDALKTAAKLKVISLSFIAKDKKTTSLFDEIVPEKKQEVKKQDFSHTGLNPDKTFKNFIKCASNEYALAASLAVSEGSAQTYNPLFIYGGVGLGKTHLMFAIGNKAFQKNLKVCYLTVEDFLNEMIKCIQKNKMESFRNKYRKCDILIIDDIHFITGKEKTQLEFFHTFNFLYNQGKQIVVASDQLPKEIKHLEERLTSRLSSGLTVDIQPPDFETRIAITKEKAEEKKVKLSNEVAEWVAKEISSNIRDIEGAVTRLGFHSKIANEAITLDFAKKTLYDLLESKGDAKLSVNLILKKTCDYFKIKVSDVKSDKRTREISTPRQVAMYICRENLPLTTVEIGHAFGGKDHSSIVVSHKKIKKLLDNDINTQQSVKGILKTLPI